jgi:hypothetical protein
MKELPYFRFVCDEWLTGDITLENYEIQGLYISVCAYYWKVNCNTTLEKLTKKFKGVPDSYWDILISGNFLKIDHEKSNGTVNIKFLDTQWEILTSEHNQQSSAGKKGAEKRWGGYKVAIGSPLGSPLGSL